MWSHQPGVGGAAVDQDEPGQGRVAPHPVVDGRALDLDVPVVGRGGDGGGEPLGDDSLVGSGAGHGPHVTQAVRR